MRKDVSGIDGMATAADWEAVRGNYKNARLAGKSYTAGLRPCRSRLSSLVSSFEPAVPVGFDGVRHDKGSRFEPATLTLPEVATNECSTVTEVEVRRFPAHGVQQALFIANARQLLELDPLVTSPRERILLHLRHNCNRSRI